MNTLHGGLVSPLFLLFGSVHAATPFSVEVNAGYGKSEVSQSGSTATDLDVQEFGLSYFLQASGTDAVPLAEAAYLAKFDSISVNYTSIGADDNEQTTTSINSRFVTPTDEIFNLGYDQFDTAGIDTNSFTVGYGRYITKGHSYTIDLNYAEEAEIVSLAYTNRLVQNNNGGKWSTLQFTTGVLDIGEGNNFAISLSGDSYLALNHSIGAGISYVDLENNSILELNLNTRYFFSDQFFTEANIIYAKIDEPSGDVDTTAYTLNVGARF